MPLARVVVDGKVVWSGEFADGMHNVEHYIKPVPQSANYWSSEQNPSDPWGYVTTETDKIYTYEFNTKEYVDKLKQVQASVNKMQETIMAPIPVYKSFVTAHTYSNEELAEVLEAAADTFLTKGWCQGDYKVTKGGLSAGWLIQDEVNCYLTDEEVGNL